MERKKYTVFLTGATGIMGKAVFHELSKHLDKINLRLLFHRSAIPKEMTKIINNNKSSIETIFVDLKKL